METILAVIGFVVVIKFCIRHRRMIMDKEAFFKAVTELRRSIVKGYANEFQHKELDDIVKSVIGDEEMGYDADAENEVLAETVIKLIKKIKQAKENEQLAKKADGIIEKIKAEIDK